MNMLISLISNFGVYLAGAAGIAAWLWRRSLKDKESGRVEVRTEQATANLAVAETGAEVRRDVAADSHRLRVKYTRPE